MGIKQMVVAEIVISIPNLYYKVQCFDDSKISG